MTPERPVLRYFGGKYVLAPWIIENLPAHKIYVEPFGGAASVLMRKPRAWHEVYNDLNDEVVNVFRVLREQNQAKELERRLRLTPFAKAEYNEAFEDTPDPVDRARRTMIRSFMGFGGDACSAGRPTGFRSIITSLDRGTTPPIEWVTFADAIPAFSARLSAVAIEKRDAFEIMELHDGPHALFYVDPPYVHDTRNLKHGYKFELSEQDHERLVSRLAEMQAMVVLSGYDSPIYDKLGWEKRKRETHADGGRDRVECLWLNPAAVKAQAQQSLFGGSA